MFQCFELQKELAAIPGASGREGKVAAAIEKLARPFCDEAVTDVMGNLILHRKGGGKKILISAHMDTVGFVLTHFEEEGFLRVGKVGGIRLTEALCATIQFENGVCGTVCRDVSKEKKELEIDGLYIDIGAKDEAEAKSKLTYGDMAVFAEKTYLAGGRILSPHLDNRIGCVILLQTLERLLGRENDLYFLFSVQEEVGLRGAKTAAYRIGPDYGIAVDVTGADDTPGALHQASARLGGGAAIKVMDRSIIAHPEMTLRMQRLAKEHGIPVQNDVLCAGGTDAGIIQKSRGGVISGGISVPTRYIHTPGEMADLQDIEACVKLLTICLEEPIS